ncbi:uncharacterized protein LOC110829467 [Zootermopsis nevadensis]|uniref:Uncharacterized protein n=1 Tax=Zootermopsis nevadensis TaxID=136037 RepID=A0A067R8N4_ZOONE|nr:uncharacterized protein LOC110829467 [Zootermopsis nevadensis]KDR19952.1 hypothetical protein L798_05230 [Zootermopsis nevadensis]
MRLLPMTNLIYFVFVLNLVHNSVLAFSTVTNSSEESVTDNFSSGLNVVFRAYEECNRVTFGEILTCLKLRALKLADRVLKSDTVQVIDGINIVKSFSKDVDRNGRRLNFKPLTEVNEAVLPTDPQQKQDKLNEMLVERVARFFRTHSVKFDLPRFVEESKHLLDGYTTSEGRRKKNRFGLLMLGGLFKGGMFALGLNGLGILAGKALLVAKIALVLSAVVGLSSLLSSGHKEEKTTYEIVEDPHVSHAYTYSSGHIDGGHGHFDSGDQGHYRKSLKIPGAAMLAYRGQRQGQNP